MLLGLALVSLGAIVVATNLDLFWQIMQFSIIAIKFGWKIVPTFLEIMLLLRYLCCLL